MVKAALERLLERPGSSATASPSRGSRAPRRRWSPRPARRASPCLICRGCRSPRSRADSGDLECLVQPVGLASTLLDLRFPMARQLRSARSAWGREARLRPSGLGELARPLGVLVVDLTARRLLDVASVHHRRSNSSSRSPTRASRTRPSPPSRPARRRTPPPSRSVDSPATGSGTPPRAVARATLPGTRTKRSPAPCARRAPRGARPRFHLASLNAIDKIVAQGPLRTSESDRRAHGNNPEPRGDPHAKQARAHRHQELIGVEGDPRSIQHFSRTRPTVSREELGPTSRL